MSESKQSVRIYGEFAPKRYRRTRIHRVFEVTEMGLVVAVGIIGIVSITLMPIYEGPQGSDYYGWEILSYILHVLWLLVSAAVFSAGALMLSGHYHQSSSRIAKPACAFVIVVGFSLMLASLILFLLTANLSTLRLLFCTPIALASLCLIIFAPRVASGEYSPALVVYALSFAAGFAAISHGCLFYVNHGSVLATVACSLGTILVVVAAIAALLPKDLRSHQCRRRKLSAVLPLAVLLTLVIGYMMPQWCDFAARSFPDLTLRSMVRAAAGKPFGSFGFVSRSDLESIEIIRADAVGIRDLSGLQYCANIQTLSLGYNKISDISPLVANPGLGSGDVVVLARNPLSETSLSEHVRYLRDRGAVVKL
jgi:hypothetical protein